MKTNQPRTGASAPLEFVFRGNAVAAGGYLTRLKGKAQDTDANIVTTHGESCLPMVGGVSRSSVEPKLAYGEYIQYGKCETFVWGRRVGDVAVTTLSAAVSKVHLRTGPSPEDNVPDVRSIAFEADRLSIEIEATHPQQGQSSFVLKNAEAAGMSLTVTRTSGENVRTPIELQFDKSVISMTTMDDLNQAFLTKQAFFNRYASQCAGKSSPVFGKTGLPTSTSGYFAGSVVKAIKFGDKVLRGNVLTTKGFGTITFGVMIADEVSRRFSIARVKMGSDPGGDVSLSGVETNGIWR